MRSKQLYSETEAKAAGEAILWVGGLEEAYHPFNYKANNRRVYSFEIVHNPLDYWTYLNQIQETEEKYLQRRDTFLNHLLARFSEQFTDYVLLMFALNREKQDLNRIVRDKSNFLSQYPTI